LFFKYKIFSLHEINTNRNMKKLILSFIAVVLVTTAFAEKKPEMMSWDEAYNKASEVLKTLSLDEKIEMTRGHNRFFLPGAPAKGLPHVYTVDASAGVRINNRLTDLSEVRHPQKTTQFPATIALASTFNTELAKAYGEAVGNEARMAGAGVLLGPGLNIYRSSQCGRNFEYMGEDPYLASQIVVPYVQGVQQQGVAACVKHYALNNEELYRHQTDVDLSDRALYEIYLPAFKAAVVEGGAWSIMGSYNKYRGTHACHNHRLICEILKGEWVFDGAVISDWGGVHYTEEAVLNGTDIHGTINIVEMVGEREKVRDTDIGRGIVVKIADLERLLYAYRKGVIKERP
jgi:beta-glucosidase